MPKTELQLADLLLQVEAELRRLELWQEERPDSTALESSIPFCADTLHFNQWLQWIFVPRMKQIIEASYPLPARCEILPYAEEFCHGQEVDTEALLHLIGCFDDLINESELTAETVVVRH
jgi:uncharacterized protein YqcC (DUF446 family)